MLKSIEAGDFGALPSGVFARNFVRQYCKAIEVEPEPIIERVFEVEPESPVPENIQEKKSYRGVIGIVVVLLVVGGFWGHRQGLWNSLFPAGNSNFQSEGASFSPDVDSTTSPAGDKKTEGAMPQQESETVDRKLSVTTAPAQSTGRTATTASGVQKASGESGVSGSEDSRNLSSTASIEKVKAGFQVRFEADEKCWVHLRCPEKEMDFILMKGELYTTTCSAPAIISVGNAEHIRVFVDNEKVIFPSGQRVVKDFVLREIGSDRD